MAGSRRSGDGPSTSRAATTGESPPTPNRRPPPPTTRAPPPGSVGGRSSRRREGEARCVRLSSPPGRHHAAARCWGERMNVMRRVAVTVASGRSSLRLVFVGHRRPATGARPPLDATATPSSRSSASTRSQTDISQVLALPALVEHRAWVLDVEVAARPIISVVTLVEEVLLAGSADALAVGRDGAGHHRTAAHRRGRGRRHLRRHRRQSVGAQRPGAPTPRRRAEATGSASAVREVSRHQMIARTRVQR